MKNMIDFGFAIPAYLSLLLSINADPGGLFGDKNSVVITAAIIQNSNLASFLRQKRQFQIKPTFEYLTAPTCFTRYGVLGRCVAFDRCYLFFKIPPPQSYNANFMMSMRDTCSFVALSGEQSTGVCCNDFGYVNANNFPIIIPAPYYPTGSNEIGGAFAIWPPAVPTHPPNNTPATHPASNWPPPVPTHPSTEATTTSSKPLSSTKPVETSTTSIPPEWSSEQPSSTTPHPTTEAVTENLYPNLEECGIKNGKQDQERIVGGHDADPGEWPWMAGILTSGRLFCGGSLIDNIHVLTAAHCVSHMNPWDVARLRIHLGDYNIKSKAEMKHVERKVKKVIRHRGFNPQTLYNDIALLKLDSPVPFSKNVRPICLSQGRITGEGGKMATVIGWGSLKEMGSTPSVLQEVNVPIWKNRECRSKYGPAAPGGIVDSFLCAGKESKDSCSGDSGGPLMVEVGKKWQQIGIVSWGIGCGKGQFPGVYTRISSFLKWINKNLNV